MAQASRDGQVSVTTWPRVIRLSGTRSRDPGVRRVFRYSDGTVAWWSGGTTASVRTPGLGNMILVVNPSWSIETMISQLDQLISQ